MVRDSSDTDGIPGPSNSNDVEKEIQEKMATGKRHYYCSDFPEAVASFQEACSLLAQKYGQIAQECGDAYYYYGISLLELARRESGVLGNALKEDSEKVEDGENEEKQDEERNSDKNDYSRESLKKETMSTEQAGPSTRKLDQVEEDDEEEEEEDPDDISNMQLAWEMLELAKVVYQKNEKSEKNSLSIALCYLHLGELGLENENYSQAIEDLQQCLDIQKEYLEATDRKLAETHYSLGLAYSFENQHNCSVGHYQNALDILKARIALLEKATQAEEGQSEKECDDVLEVREIEALLPDISSKIEDVIEASKEAKRQLDSLSMQKTGETTTGFSASSSISDTSCSIIPICKIAPISSSDGSVSDISHLVRRKRAPPSDGGVVPEVGSASKRPRRESAHDEENGSKGSAGRQTSEETATNASSEKEEDGTLAPKIAATENTNAAAEPT